MLRIIILQLYTRRRSSSLHHYFFFLLSLLIFHNQAKANNNHIFIYSGCSQEKYPQNSLFENNLNSLLSSIISSASQAQLLYNSFSVGNNNNTDSSSSSSSIVYGLYQCRGDLNTRDCSTCVANLVSQIQLVCPNNYGAELQMDRCFVRYENFDFLGKLDASLRFKRCSQRINRNDDDDGEFLKRRDDVLGNLVQAAAGSGSFRVSNYGSVEGYGQCLGDLSGEDCSTCLADAVAQLRSLCGSAAAADVFLSQCYVRYWASGYYVSSDSSGGDAVGRMVAIIVGVLAGAAIVVVLLSICRKFMIG